MSRRRAFTLIELLVVIAIIAVLMAILMPALSRVRDQGRQINCAANLRNWNLQFNLYVGENDGKFYTGTNGTGYWWVLQLPEKEQNWRDNGMWFCPTATKPIYPATSSTATLTRNIYNSWGIFTTANGLAPASATWEGKTYVTNKYGFNGSFSLNGYLLGIPATGSYEGGVPAKNGYRKITDAKNTNSVPVMMDGLRFDTWPLENQAPAVKEDEAWSSNNMGRVCINRHRGFTNVSFLDWSVRKAGLKELYTFQWHQKWNPRGPFTLAGGVSADSWPDWLRPHKDY
jgi:prepilin-type N-terminal cleavage/methylation domain-containing protein/prepilin-type processing-associated H-X9-DG protein